MREQLAWAAGFIDGEGCFGIHREADTRKGPNYKNFRSSLQISNTCEKSLKALQKILFGFGQLSQVTQKTSRRKAIFKLNFRNKLNLISICFALLPFLVTKHAAAENLLAFCISREVAKRTGRGRYAPYSANDHRMHRISQTINYRYREPIS